MESDSSPKESGPTKSDSSDPTYHPGSSYSGQEPKYKSPEEEVESDPVDWDRLVSSKSSGTCQSKIQSSTPHNKFDLLVDQKMTSSDLYYPDPESPKHPIPEREEVNANPNPLPQEGDDSSSTETDSEANLTDDEDSSTESEHYRREKERVPEEMMESREIEFNFDKTTIFTTPSNPKFADEERRLSLGVVFGVGDKLLVPSLSDRAHHSEKGMCFYWRSDWCGIHLPFSPFVVEILRTLNVAPAQLNDVAWCHINSFEALFRSSLYFNMEGFVMTYDPFLARIIKTKTKIDDY